MSKSLRKDTQKFAKLAFPEVYPRVRLNLIKRFISFINSPKYGLLVIPITVILFLIGQIVNPKEIQWLHIPIDTSRIIIDQRISNLATIFSITLVVIGWLLTNLSIKESLSFKLLFKRTYLYPIFYFVGSLIACLIVFSLFRHEVFINLGNIIIAGTCLIIVAIILITLLFVNFIRVVDSAFIYEALGSELIKEVNFFAKSEILFRRSRTLYKEKCELMLLEDGIRFNTNLSNHIGINITPIVIEGSSLPGRNADIFEIGKSYEVYDINLSKLEKELKKLEITSTSYYRPLQIGSNISGNFSPFVIHNSIILPKKFSTKVKKAFNLKPPRKQKVLEYKYLNYFNDRFMKDVDEGKKENIKKGLEIYSRIFALEDKIYSQC